MASELEDDTVVRPRPVVAPALDDLDADTIIRARTPFADVPVEALELVAEPALAPEPPKSRADLTATDAFDYAFRVNSADVIALDTAVIVGRRPSLPRITGTRVPRPRHRGVAAA